MYITPISHPLAATVRVPGSKSLTNRALLIAALAEGTTTLTNALFSDDSRYFAAALQALGFHVSLNQERAEMTVTGLGGKIPAGQATLFIGNAGTAARFLTAFLTLGNGEYILDGDTRMRERPIGGLVDGLTQLGVKIESASAPNELRSLALSEVEGTYYDHLCPPIKITAGGLPGGKTTVAGNISSQFLSALLMVAPYAQSPLEIEVTTELNSKPYVDMTVSIMRDFGIEVKHDKRQTFRIPLGRYALRNTNIASTADLPGSPINANLEAHRMAGAGDTSRHDHAGLLDQRYFIESDASAASYFFAAPAICGGTVAVENISRSSVQGDIAFLDVLAQMGCRVEETENPGPRGKAGRPPRPAIPESVGRGIRDEGVGPTPSRTPSPAGTPLAERGAGCLLVTAHSSLRGVDVDMRDIPDTAQTLAAIAPFAVTPTRIRGIASARLKETDRVHATCTELARLGVRVEEHEDGLTIYPCDDIRPATVRTYNDHRMAMAFSLIGLRVPGIEIENPGCVSKTFPEFFDVLGQLGKQVDR